MKKLHLFKTSAVFAIAMACLTTSQAAISVGPAGTGILNFNSTAPPAPTEFSTGVLTGDAATYTNASSLEIGVNTVTAANIVRTLPQSSTLPPSTFSGGFRHNTNAAGSFFLQSRPTTDGTNAAGVLLATLQNDTGGDLTTFTISYTFGTNSPAVGEVPGFRVFYSLSGSPGSWQLIPGLSDSETPGVHSAVVPVGTWSSGTILYLLWADDNANGVTDPSYTIDDFSVVPGGVVVNSITITSPTNGATFAQGVPITINATATMGNPITNVAFFSDNVLIGK